MLTAEAVKDDISFRVAEEAIIRPGQRGVLCGWGHKQGTIQQGRTYITPYFSCIT